MKLKKPALATLRCVAVLFVAGSAAMAAADEELTSRGELVLPANGLVKLEVFSPEKVRVSKSYAYEIRVTNVSENVAVHDVQIVQLGSENLKIEESNLAGADNSKKKASSNSDDQQTDESARSKWKIPHIMPGDTKVIRVTASADEPAKQKMCIAVASYTPALCISTEFTKPELEIVKRQTNSDGEPVSGKKVNICEPVYFGYYVKNNGTGNPGRFTITDELPEGLTTVDGDSKLSFVVDGLPAGETRGFKTQLAATKTGTLGSRAIAETKAGQTARSNSADVTIVAPELAVSMEGVERTYAGRDFEVIVRVTNHGSVASTDTQIGIDYPKSLELVHTADLKQSRKKVQRKKNAKSSDRPTPAKKGKAKTSKQDKQESEELGDDWTSEVWNVGALKPGQTVVAMLSLRGDGDAAGDHKVRGTVRYFCGEGEGKRTLNAMAMADLEVIALPALQIIAFDDEDPVKLDSQVVYTIRVLNEGQADDHEVELSAELPAGMSFVSGEGDTKVTGEGQNISFGPRDVLEPGERLSWKVTAKSDSAGDKRFRAELNSKSLSRPAIAEEPTRFFKSRDN